MNCKSFRTGGSIRTSSRSLQALMHAATLGIALIGALSVGRAAQAEESHGHFEGREWRVEHFDRGRMPGAAFGEGIDRDHERFAIGHRIDRLPERSVPLFYRGEHYFVSNGIWFHGVGDAYFVAAAPIGAVVPV